MVLGLKPVLEEGDLFVRVFNDDTMTIKTLQIPKGFVGLVRVSRVDKAMGTVSVIKDRHI